MTHEDDISTCLAEEAAIKRLVAAWMGTAAVDVAYTPRRRDGRAYWQAQARHYVAGQAPAIPETHAFGKGDSPGEACRDLRRRVEEFLGGSAARVVAELHAAREERR